MSIKVCEAIYVKHRLERWGVGAEAAQRENAASGHSGAAAPEEGGGADDAPRGHVGDLECQWGVKFSLQDSEYVEAVRVRVFHDPVHTHEDAAAFHRMRLSSEFVGLV